MDLPTELHADNKSVLDISHDYVANDKTKHIETKTEEAIYNKLGLAWVPPELREDRGEVALAEQSASRWRTTQISFACASLSSCSCHSKPSPR